MCGTCPARIGMHGHARVHMRDTVAGDRFLLRHQGLKAAEVKQEMLTLRCLFLDAAARDAERILSEAGPTGNHVFLRRSDLVLLELACKQTARACWNLQGDDRSNPGRRVTIARLADLVDCARSRQRAHAEQVCVVARVCFLRGNAPHS